LIHPYPKQWPWLLITASIHADCSKGDHGRTYDQCLKPLLMDCIMAAQAAQAKMRRGGKVTLPLVLEGTISGKVYINPNNDNGGMTVYKPSDN
jgi:hypothetical protein